MQRDCRSSGREGPRPPSRASAVRASAYFFFRPTESRTGSRRLLHAGQELLELVVIHVRAWQGQIIHQLDVLRILRGLPEPITERLQNLGRRPLGHGQASPVEDRVLDRVAGLGEGRHIGEDRVAGRAVGRQDAELICLVELEHFVHAGGGDADVAADQRGARRRRSVKGDVGELQVVLLGQRAAERCQGWPGPEWPTVTTPGLALAYSTRSFNVLNCESVFTEKPAGLRLRRAIRSKSR